MYRCSKRKALRDEATSSAGPPAGELQRTLSNSPQVERRSRAEFFPKKFNPAGLALPFPDY
jgi:hypothetical protein